MVVLFVVLMRSLVELASMMPSDDLLVL